MSIPAGSPSAITRRCLASGHSLGEDMLRLLVIGLLLYGLGTALREGWLEVQWSRFLHDAGLTFIDPDRPLRFDEIPGLSPERSD